MKHCIHLHCKYSLILVIICLISFSRNKTAVRFEVLKVVLMQSRVFWDVMPYHCVRASRFYKTPATANPMTQHSIPEYLNLQQNRCCKLIFLCKSWIFLNVYSFETLLANVLYAAISWSNLRCQETADI